MVGRLIGLGILEAFDFHGRVSRAENLMQAPTIHETKRLSARRKTLKIPVRFVPRRALC